MNTHPELTAAEQQLASIENTTLNAKVKIPDINANSTLNAKVKLPDIYANKRSTISFRQH